MENFRFLLIDDEKFFLFLRDYYESDSGLLSPTMVKKFTTAKFYEQFNPSQKQQALMTPPQPQPPPRPHRMTYTALSGQIAANMENLASVINRIKPPLENSSTTMNGNAIVVRRKTSLDVEGLSPGSSSNSSGLVVKNFYFRFEIIYRC